MDVVESLIISFLLLREFVLRDQSRVVWSFDPLPDIPLHIPPTSLLKHYKKRYDLARSCFILEKRRKYWPKQLHPRKKEGDNPNNFLRKKTRRSQPK